MLGQQEQDPLNPRYRSPLSWTVGEPNLPGAASYGQEFSPSPDQSWQEPWWKPSLDSEAFSPSDAALSSSGAGGQGKSGQPEADKRPRAPSVESAKLLSGVRGPAPDSEEPSPEKPSGPASVSSGPPGADIGSLSDQQNRMITPPTPAQVAASQPSGKEEDPIQAGLQGAAKRIITRAEQPLPEKKNAKGPLGWLQRLGSAYLATTALAPFADQIIHPKYSKQMGDLREADQRDRQELKDLESVSSTLDLGEQRKAHAQQYRDTEATKRMGIESKEDISVRAAKQKQEAELLRHEDATLKGRDAMELQEGENPPPGWDLINSVARPGVRFAAAPRFVRLPEEMLPYFPGRKKDDPVPYEEFKQAQHTAQQVLVNQNKPDSREPNQFARFAIEFQRTHPGASEADLQHAFMLNSQHPPQPQQPPQALMIGPNGQAIVVRPGTQVPQGSVTPQGESSMAVPTAATRTMSEAAPKVVSLVDKVSQMVQKQSQSLGPLSSRWSEFMAGKVGAPNPEFTTLRTDVGLLQTLLMRMHVGARGGEQIMKHFADLIDSGRQSPQNLQAALSAIREYAQEVAHLGSQGQNGPAAPASAPAAPIVQKSPSTGQFRYSVDGGKSWLPGQPPK